MYISVDDGKTKQSNKFYNMIQISNTEFKVEYGRVGCETPNVETKSMSKWDSVYKSKLKKGYKDVTELYLESVGNFPTKTQIEIVEKLMKYANQSISDNYTVSAKNVTIKQLDKADEVLNSLFAFDKNDLDGFNKLLMELYTIVPRKMKNVKDFLANNSDQIDTILNDEKDNLDVMRGQVQLLKGDVNESETENTNNDLLTNLGLSIVEIDNNDTKTIKMIKDMMGSDSHLFHKAYAVVNNNTQKAFDEFLSTTKNKQTKLLWHGSRNQNWWSIVCNGLKIRLSGVIHTGSLLGDAVYFADVFNKSFGYTDSGRWVNNKKYEYAYLALYDVHIGNQFHMKDKAYAIRNPKNELYDKNYDSVYAHKGASMGYSDLRCSEYTVYNHDQSTIKYLIEVKVK